MFSSDEVTVTSVRQHLRQMNLIFEETNSLTKFELYEYLLNVSDQYEKKNKQNFASVVHKLHPRKYTTDK